MSFDPQAAALNTAIRDANPAVERMLAERGRGIFFPKLGVLSQGAEAAGKDINATVGIALEDDGSPVALPSVARSLTLPLGEAFPYAPSPGRADIRKRWREMMLQKNPGLAGQAFGQPVVTAALTHGLSMAGYLFCDPGDRVILPDLYWENYDLIFANAYGGVMDTFPTYTSTGAFNVDGLAAKLAGPAGKRIVLLNFPNNPSGYTPTVAEAKAIAKVLTDAAARGNQVVVLVDDAYFGLVFEEGVLPESIFVDLCQAHPNLLAVKIDGATKEDYVWGFRVGFLTFGIKGGTTALFDALEGKAAGAIRGNISNSSNPAQSMLVRSWTSGAYDAEKKEKFDLLLKRYRTVREILRAHPEYAEEYVPLPFNSGYFMCVRPTRVDAEALRKKLLADYSTGTINFNGVLRIAFSATPTQKLAALFDNIYRASRDLSGAGARSAPAASGARA
jgi:aspartate/methionine/tyrosine aminotransferase